MESLDQSGRLEVHEKARNVFCDEPVRLSDHNVLHNIASSSSFFSILHGFSHFFRPYCILYFTFLEFKEFNETIIPFALVGYETEQQNVMPFELVMADSK